MGKEKGTKITLWKKKKYLINELICGERGSPRKTKSKYQESEAKEKKHKK